jgi:hypothetical protein
LVGQLFSSGLKNTPNLKGSQDKIKPSFRPFADFGLKFCILKEDTKNLTSGRKVAWK